MINEILEEREKTHGPYTITAAVSQSIKAALHLSPANRPYIARESLDMIAGKMARIVSGNWREIDHWQDIIGYAQLVIDEINKANAKD